MSYKDTKPKGLFVTDLDGTLLRSDGTSPLDGKSIWIELFPSHVSKGSATAWLSQRLGLKSESVCAVGNDYNDTTLLEWSGSGFVVENAPEDLRARFSCVFSNDDCGVTNAVKRWLGSRTS